MRLKLVRQESKSCNRTVEEDCMIVSLGVTKVRYNLLDLEFEATVGSSAESRLEVTFTYDCHLTEEESKRNAKEVIEENIDKITKHTLPLLAAIDRSMNEINLDLEYEEKVELEEEFEMYS